MSLSKLTRRSLIAAALLPLIGCGYEPAFGPTGQSQALLNQVSVPEARDKRQFDFNAQFERRLGHASDGTYELAYSIKAVREGVAIRVGGDVFRYNLVGTVNFSLNDAATGKKLVSSKVEGFTSYSVVFVDNAANPTSTSATIASVAAREDAEDRLMIILADQVVTRLVATSGTWAK